MNSIGFLKSDKENEKRIAILPEDIRIIKNKGFVYIEKDYGKELNISDDDYIKAGCNVVPRSEAMGKDIIVDPKIGDAIYLKDLKNQKIFGWIHATQNHDITQRIIDNKLTAYAWEKMFDESRHIYYKNNQIAGEAAILHAMLSYGRTFEGLKVAVLGNGNTSRGAVKVLNKIGANVNIYNSRQESLFKKEFMNYDIIVNCILWDVNRKDHIIKKSDLANMKKGSLIIDISCDRNGGIETSIPTTIENPIYEVDGVLHYAVDHTPSLLFKDSSKSISNEVSKFVDCLIEDKTNKVLDDCLIIKDGVIIDQEINKFQNR